MIEKLIKLRYTKPLLALKEDSITKTIVSLLASAGAFLLDIFYVEPQLIALLVAVMFLDLITGMYSSQRNDIPLTSIGFRQSVVKALEYFGFLFILSGVSNVFGAFEGEGWVGEIFVLARNIDLFGYFYLILTELKSVAENVSGKEGRLSQLFEEIKKRVLKDN